MNITMSYDRGFFIDDSQVHIDKIASCGGNIETIKVNSSGNNPRVHLFEMNDYYKLLGPEAIKAATIVALILAYKESPYESLDILSGMTDEQMNQIKTSVTTMKQTNPDIKIVGFFDWDRTITKIEGLWSFGNNGIEGLKDILRNLTASKFGQISLVNELKQKIDGLTAEGYLEYYCGGTNRLNSLKTFFDFLLNEGVDVYIVTNNGACASNRKLFDELKQHLATNGDQIKLFCSIDQLQGLLGDKKIAIQKIAGTEKICPITNGGTRKIKRRKRKTMRRKTIKRKSNK